MDSVLLGISIIANTDHMYDLLERLYLMLLTLTFSLTLTSLTKSRSTSRLQWSQPHASEIQLREYSHIPTSPLHTLNCRIIALPVFFFDFAIHFLSIKFWSMKLISIHTSTHQ